MNLPYLTADLPGIGGRIKETPEDFQVEEVPLYEPCGEGTHVYFRVRKTGLSTPAAVERIARHLGVRRGEIGYAGLKDATAVSIQTMSVEHVEPERIETYRDPQIRIEWTRRHGNKLRPGHLAANRFHVLIRGVEPAEEAEARARAILEVLSRRGVPNYFGHQRFGARGDTARLGEALVRGDPEGFVRLFLGRPRPDDPPDCRAARDAFDTGAFERAMSRWPRHYADQRRALAAYRRKKRAGPALAAIDKRMKRLFVSAFQSEIFNEVLARRIETIDRVLTGDLARKTDTGGIFTVEDAAAEQPRAEAFEISPTGPLPGYRADLAGGQPGEIERAVLTEHAVHPEDFRRLGALKAKGSRRALRFSVEEFRLQAGADDRGERVELSFTAPSGAYATVLLREIMKND